MRMQEMPMPKKPLPVVGMSRSQIVELKAMARPTHPWELKEREPGTGRFKREEIGDVMALARLNRIKLGVPEIEIRSHLAGSVLGRLRLDQTITAEQYAVGERWGAVVARYARLMGIPRPNPKSASATMTGGSGGHGDDQLDEDAIAKVRRDYADAYSALIDCTEGRAYMAALKAVVLCDQSAHLGNLRCGLNVLCKLWR